IAEALGQTEASISRQIKLMVADGLLLSTVSPHNRREHITNPTAKGLRLAEEAMAALNRYHTPMFERMNDNQLAVLRDTLTGMHECVCQAGKTGACDHPF